MSNRDALQAVMDRFIHEIWNGRKLGVVAEVFREDATVHLGNTAVTGLEAIRGFMGEVQTAFPDLHYEVADLFFDGDNIAMRYVGTATVRSDDGGEAAAGKKLDYEGMAIFHMDGNRIAEVWSQSDRTLKFGEL